MEVFRSDVKVGIFITLASALFLVAVFKAGGILERFEKTRRVTIVFSNAQQVDAGTEVLFRGIKVGRVDRILLGPEGHRVFVITEIDPKYALYSGTRAKILAKSFLGGKVIELLPPPRTEQPPALLGEDEEIVGLVGGDLNAVLDSVDAMIPKYQVKADEVFSKLFQTIDNLDKAIDEAREGVKGLSEVGPTAISALETYRNLAHELEPDVRRVLAKLDAAADAVPQRFDKMGTDFNALTIDLRQQVEAVGGDLRTVLAKADNLVAHADDLMVDNREDLDASIASLRRSLENLESFSQQIADRPSSLVWKGRKRKQ